MPTYSPYKAGGSLAWNDPTYVSRQADHDLYYKIRQGLFCHVLGPHQTGKSSLRIRVRRRLEEGGYRCATVQATQMGCSLNAQNSQENDPWDKPLIASIWDSLNPSDSSTITSWLEATAQLSSQRRLEHFTRDLLFPELLEKPLVIFIDEIDYLLGIPQAICALFRWIEKSRSLQANRQEYKTLSFVVLGSTTVESIKQSVFSAEGTDEGQSLLKQLFSTAGNVHLNDFELTETQPLQQGLSHKLNAVATLKAILKWTNGQPFLTQKLCRIIAEQGVPESQLRESQLRESQLSSPATLNRWVAAQVQVHLIHDWQHQDDPVHLRDIRDRLQRSPDQKALRKLYHRVSSGQRVFYKGNRIQKELMMIGLVRRQNRRLYVANKIYRHVFSPQSAAASPNAFLSAPFSQFLLKKGFYERRDRLKILNLRDALRPAWCYRRDIHSC